MYRGGVHRDQEGRRRAGHGNLQVRRRRLYRDQRGRHGYVYNDLEMPERHWEVGSHYLLFARARVASPVSPYTGHPRSAIKKGCELLCGAIAACVKAFCNALAACRKAIVNGYASFLVRYAAATAVVHALLTLTYLSRVSDRQG